MLGEVRRTTEELVHSILTLQCDLQRQFQVTKEAPSPASPNTQQEVKSPPSPNMPMVWPARHTPQPSATAPTRSPSMVGSRRTQGSGTHRDAAAPPPPPLSASETSAVPSKGVSVHSGKKESGISPPPPPQAPWQQQSCLPATSPQWPLLRQEAATVKVLPDELQAAVDALMELACYWHGALEWLEWFLTMEVPLLPPTRAVCPTNTALDTMGYFPRPPPSTLTQLSYRHVLGMVKAMEEITPMDSSQAAVDGIITIESANSVYSADATRPFDPHLTLGGACQEGVRATTSAGGGDSRAANTAVGKHPPPQQKRQMTDQEKSQAEVERSAKAYSDAVREICALVEVWKAAARGTFLWPMEPTNPVLFPRAKLFERCSGLLNKPKHDHPVARALQRHLRTVMLWVEVEVCNSPQDGGDLGWGRVVPHASIPTLLTASLIPSQTLHPTSMSSDATGRALQLSAPTPAPESLGSAGGSAPLLLPAASCTASPFHSQLPGAHPRLVGLLSEVQRRFFDLLREGSESMGYTSRVMVMVQLVYRAMMAYHTALYLGVRLPLNPASAAGREVSTASGSGGPGMGRSSNSGRVRKTLPTVPKPLALSSTETKSAAEPGDPTNRKDLNRSKGEISMGSAEEAETPSSTRTQVYALRAVVLAKRAIEFSKQVNRSLNSFEMRQDGYKSQTMKKNKTEIKKSPPAFTSTKQMIQGASVGENVITEGRERDMMRLLRHLAEMFLWLEGYAGVDPPPPPQRAGQKVAYLSTTEERSKVEGGGDSVSTSNSFAMVGSLSSTGRQGTALGSSGALPPAPVSCPPEVIVVTPGVRQFLARQHSTLLAYVREMNEKPGPGMSCGMTNLILLCANALRGFAMLVNPADPDVGIKGEGVGSWTGETFRRSNSLDPDGSALLGDFPSVSHSSFGVSSRSRTLVPLSNNEVKNYKTPTYKALQARKLRQQLEFQKMQQELNKAAGGASSAPNEAPPPPPATADKRFLHDNGPYSVTGSFGAHWVPQDGPPPQAPLIFSPAPLFHLLSIVHRSVLLGYPLLRRLSCAVYLSGVAYQRTMYAVRTSSGRPVEPKKVQCTALSSSGETVESSRSVLAKMGFPESFLSLEQALEIVHRFGEAIEVLKPLLLPHAKALEGLSELFTWVAAPDPPQQHDLLQPYYPPKQHLMMASSLAGVRHHVFTVRGLCTSVTVSCLSDQLNEDGQRRVFGDWDSQRRLRWAAQHLGWAASVEDGAQFLVRSEQPTLTAMAPWTHTGSSPTLDLVPWGAWYLPSAPNVRPVVPEGSGGTVIPSAPLDRNSFSGSSLFGTQVPKEAPMGPVHLSIPPPPSLRSPPAVATAPSSAESRPTTSTTPPQSASDANGRGSRLTASDPQHSPPSSPAEPQPLSSTFPPTRRGSPNPPLSNLAYTSPFAAVTTPVKPYTFEEHPSPIWVPP